MWTGSVIERDGLFYLFYTGHRIGAGNPQTICLATSRDQVHLIMKHEGNPLLLPSAACEPVDWRDPYVFYSELAPNWHDSASPEARPRTHWRPSHRLGRPIARHERCFGPVAASVAARGLGLGQALEHLSVFSTRFLGADEGIGTPTRALRSRLSSFLRAVQPPSPSSRGRARFRPLSLRATACSRFGGQFGGQPGH